MVALCHDPELLVFTEYKEYTFPLRKKNPSQNQNKFQPIMNYERKKPLQNEWKIIA